jgi:hypothetical protein
LAVKADFTEAEWQTLEKGVTGAGMVVALADASFLDTFKEAGALTGYLGEARQKSSSLLVRDLAASARGSGFSARTSSQQLETETLDALRSAVAILQAKAPDETAAYSAFVLEVADAVANAVSGVAPAENAAIEKVKGALQLQAT